MLFGFGWSEVVALGLLVGWVGCCFLDVVDCFDWLSVYGIQLRGQENNVFFACYFGTIVWYHPLN